MHYIEFVIKLLSIFKNSFLFIFFVQNLDFFRSAPLMPTTKLIPPSAGSIFPLPTLSSSVMPEQIPIPSLMPSYSPPIPEPPPVQMPQSGL